MEHFFVGCHQASDVKRFDYAMISVNRIRARREIGARHWCMDSGAFQEIARFGAYRHEPRDYAAEIRRWKGKGNLMAAVTQDYMCEPHILERTHLPVVTHQRLTIERYDALLMENTGVYIMPVLQGYAPEQYVQCIRAYGERLRPGMWVGVGSVCKRNSNPRSIEDVLLAIADERPDLRLHGFGIKITSLESSIVQALLWSADSNAWSYAARREGRSPHDWREGDKYRKRVAGIPVQHHLFVQAATA